MAKMRMKWNDKAVITGVESQKKQALFKGASHIHGESTKIAPIDDGILIQTSGVDVGENEASVYYTQKYAVRLHENPQFNFQRGRQGKYLEQPVQQERAKVIKFMQEEMKKAFK